MQNRRNFLAHTALAGAGLAIGLPSLTREAFALTFTADPLAAGTHLTPILVVDDALRLSLLNLSLNDDLKAAMISNQAFYQSSGTLARNASDLIVLLGTIRDQWGGRDKMKVTRHEYNGDMLESKLAFVAGWFAHQAAQHQIYGNNRHEGIDEKALYHDITLCRSIYQSEPVAKKSKQPTVDELAQLLQQMYTRTYVRMHTIDPDFDDVENWIVRYVKWSEDTKALTEQYANAYLNPDPEKLQMYVKEPGFYDPANPIIALARELHQGITESTIDLKEAIHASASQSQYAQALGVACNRIEAIGAFMDGKLDQTGLQKMLKMS